jgi:hypothetical protein
MKKPKKTTALDRLATRLRMALRHETKKVVEIGKLLIESRQHLQHGEWQAWLAENFSLSYRTAVKYLNAAEYVERTQKCTEFTFTNLSPTVLYWLAAGYYNEQQEAAILAATRNGRVGQDAATAICETITPVDDDDDDDADDDDDQDHDDDDGGGSDSLAAEADESQRKTLCAKPAI